MTIRTGRSAPAPAPGSPNGPSSPEKTSAPSAAAPAAKAFAPVSRPVTVKGTGFEGPAAPARPPPAAAPLPSLALGEVGGPSAAGARPTLAVAFDNIKAPGGPTQSRLLSDGLDSWNARLEMLESATTSIDTSYFILEKDPYGFAFLGGLLKKQLEGVPVRLSTDAMADTFGKNGFKMAGRGQDYLQELVNHGAQAFIYHPISSRVSDLLRGDFGTLASNHDKLLVIDGKRSITGGRNVAQDYFASPKDVKGAWRDMDIAFEGEAAAAGLTAAFDAELVNGDASRPVGKDLLGNWDKKDVQLLGAYELMNAWVKAPAFSAAEKAAIRGDPTKLEGLAAALVAQALTAVQTTLPGRAPSKKDLEFLKAQALTLVSHVDTRGSRHSYDAGASKAHPTQVKIIDQTSAASGQRTNNMAEPLIALVESATKRLVIQNPYVVLTRDMLSALERASARGVEISIITNSPLSTDSAVTQAFFLDDWQMILARCPNARIFVATGDRKFHGKSAVIDDDQSVVSTYNLDLLSGFINGEVGALIESKEVATDLTAAFADDTNDPSNGFLEYTIEKDAQGNAVIRDGEPVRKFGPEEHLPKEVLEDYAKKKHLWGKVIRDNIGYFEPLRHGPTVR